MIENPAVARQISEFMLDISTRIHQSVAATSGLCTPQDRAAYRRAAGKILAAIRQELLNPLYAEHTALRPEGWCPVLPAEAETSRSLGGIIQPM